MGVDSWWGAAAPRLNPDIVDGMRVESDAWEEARAVAAAWIARSDSGA